MPLYEARVNVENKLEIPAAWGGDVAVGHAKTISRILEFAAGRSERRRPLRMAFDGWYGVPWRQVMDALQTAAARGGLKIEVRDFTSVFKSPEELEAYKRPFVETDDPGFGLVNTDGHIGDLTVPEKVAELRSFLTAASGCDAVIVCGAGAALPELCELYDKILYFDKTRQPILWEMWGGRLIPFGWTEPKKGYGWKEYYYCDYYLLDRHKEFILPRMDYWVEGISFEGLKLMPREVYDGIIKALVRRPVKEIPIFQPGPWGAYRFKDLFDVSGLECNAWNELAGPELSMLVELGGGVTVNMPTMNLMQYPDLFVGSYLAETYPGLFPMDVWLDDGYFPEPMPAERISMPIHNHPSTDYVRRHFKEPLGRYETYYIAEAYEGANTWMGYKDEADLEEWERLCRESNNRTVIPNWTDFIANWETNVGDLFLIPPGTVHGHGGNQMVLEMDTCPSIAATEYSFFLYDFARPSWDDTKKTMTGKPVKMHLEHGFDNEKWVRESWVKEHLRARPRVIKWTKEYMLDRYTSDSRMPFEIERYHFERRADADTEGRFMHIVTLTAGNAARIRSKADPVLCNTLHRWQSALVPACFGEYEFVNECGGACTVVQLRWKKG